MNSLRCGISLAVLMMIGALVIVAGCHGYVPGAKSYWDNKVNELCVSDGGLTVYQKVRVSQGEIRRHVLPTSAGRLSVATKEMAHPDAPIYSIESTTTLRDANPVVRRTESLIVRRADQAVVAKTVYYARVGGDMPTGLSDGTSFICPNLQKMASDLHEQLFLIEDDAK